VMTVNEQRYYITSSMIFSYACPMCGLAFT